MLSLAIEHSPQIVHWEQEFQEDQDRQALQRKLRKRPQRDSCTAQVERLRRELNEIKHENTILQVDNALLTEELRLRLPKDEMEKLSVPTTIAEAMVERSEKSLRYAEHMLPKFSGGDPKDFASEWLNTISSNAAIFNWTEDQTLLAAKITVEGPARQWLTGQRRDIQTWKDFKTAFEARFGKGRPNAANVHMAMAKRKRRSDENVVTFVVEMEELGSRIDLDEKCIVDYIINGLDESTIMEAKLRSAQSLNELKKRLEKLNGDNVDLNGNQAIVEVHIVRTNKRCYNCKEVGHLYENCDKFFEGELWKCIVFIVIFIFAVGL